MDLPLFTKRSFNQPALTISLFKTRPFLHCIWFPSLKCRALQPLDDGQLTPFDSQRARWERGRQDPPRLIQPAVQDTLPLSIPRLDQCAALWDSKEQWTITVDNEAADGSGGALIAVCSRYQRISHTARPRPSSGQAQQVCESSSGQ